MFRNAPAGIVIVAKFTSFKIIQHETSIYRNLLFSGFSFFPVRPTGRKSEKKSLKAEPYGTYSEVVLLDSTSVNVAPTGSGKFSIYKAILVQSVPGALNNRVICFDYDPLTAFAQFKYANIHKADGTIHPIDIQKAQDYTAPARAIYWGARQIMLEIGKLEPGDIIEYEIDKKGFTMLYLTGNNEEERFIPPNAWPVL